MAEDLAIGIENYVNSQEFKQILPATGTDVKVMIVRIERSFDITLCLPFHPELTADSTYYYSEVEKAHKLISDKIASLFREKKDAKGGYFRLAINTKDRGDKVYLSPFGTALGKGDCGAVGRGNRYNGIISPVRSSNIEAFAGKNPLHHVGKLYNAIAYTIADRIYQATGKENQVIITTRNGDELKNPTYLAIDLAETISLTEERTIREIAMSEIDRVAEYSSRLIMANPIYDFRRR